MTRAGLQGAQILCALGLGLSLGVLYDFYRTFLKKNRKGLWCWLGDFLWWLAALAWTFFLLVKISWAELRIPVVSAVFGGIVVYLYYFSPVLRPLYRKGGRWLGRALNSLRRLTVGIVSFLFAPLVAFIGGIYRLCAAAEKGCHCLVTRTGRGLSGVYRRKRLIRARKRLGKKQGKQTALSDSESSAGKCKRKRGDPHRDKR